MIKTYCDPNPKPLVWSAEKLSYGLSKRGFDNPDDYDLRDFVSDVTDSYVPGMNIGFADSTRLTMTSW